MHVSSEKEAVYDLAWNDHITYGDVYHQAEVEHSRYNFDQADPMLLSLFAPMRRKPASCARPVA